MFISFEGPEGSGKTTHAEKLGEYLEQQDYTVNLTREPGGTPLGERLRELLLDPAHGEMTPRTELFMYLASRAQHVAERIQPALSRGEIVITDRFTDATVIYQGIARSLGKQWVRKLNDWATEGLEPDLTVILDIPVDVGLEDARKGSRTQWNTSRGDRLEQEDDRFHQNIRQAYRELARDEPGRCLLLERSEEIEDLQQKIQDRVTRKLSEQTTSRT